MLNKFSIAALAPILFGSQLASAATSVSAGSGGSVSYDATTATMTATHNNVRAELNDSSRSTGLLTLFGGSATVKISFAAPLVRTDEFRQSEWNGSGHRSIASFVRGTVIDFEYVVNSSPDSNGLITNLLTVKSKPGFSIPYVSMDQLAYYYDFDGNIRGGYRYLHDPYSNYYDMAFIALFPPCNCVSSIPLDVSTSAFTATSDLPGYVQNIYRDSNVFAMKGYNRAYDLWDVTESSVSVIDSYTEASWAFWSPGVPEPANWAMMIAGFGLVGAALRRQRQSVIALPASLSRIAAISAGLSSCRK